LGVPPLRVSVIIPTYNAEKHLSKLLAKINKAYEVIVIDSSSTDRTLEVASQFNTKLVSINKSEFNHGKTRNLASQYANGDILVFLTQDAIPVDNNSICKLVEVFKTNKNIGVAYGRQIPYDSSSHFGKFARLFNYPQQSKIKTIRDVKTLGIKTVFSSNSFAAYRKDLLEAVGMFPNNVILSEDTYVAAKIIKNGYSVAYVSEAAVYHSHDYSIIQEFKRYFDIGVFYGRENWILREFATAESEGIRFVKEEIQYLIKQRVFHLIPVSIIRNGMKFLGYRLGINEKIIPKKLKKYLSMHSSYWN
jgi:rhamnosyltransferase